MRHRIRAIVVGALVVGLAATGCQKNTGDDDNKGATDKNNTAITVDYKGETPVPAPEVEGAKPGGTITSLKLADFEHLDPQQIYVSDSLTAGTYLFHRTLTGYIEDAKGGPLKLVGDLATNAGETTDGGKTWKYTLRDGVKYDDGSTILAKDIAYGIARSFSTYGLQGPQYLQAALDPGKTYKGPYDGGALLPPGVTTPDDKTVVFTFAEPHPELPYLLAYPTDTPVPQAKDTKENYETTFVSSGPYKTKEYKRGKYLILEKNTNWDPKTDPIRHQYVDGFKFEMGVTEEQQTDRVKAGLGADATAVMEQDVPPSKIAEVKADPDVVKLATGAPSPYTSYLNINTTRITDLAIRQALNYAFNRDAYIKAVGGYDVAEPATTLMSPAVPGYKKYDAYPRDVEKAKSLIAGKTLPKYKYCYADTPINETVVPVVQAGLKEAGFDFTSAAINPDTYYTTIGKKGNDCDIMFSAWAQDWPDGESTLGVLFDGSKIVDEGNQNYSYFNDPGVVAKLKELRFMTDRGAAGTQYGALDEQIMKDFAPAIPLRFIRNYTLQGKNVGGTFVSPLYAAYNLTGIYVKS